MGIDVSRKRTFSRFIFTFILIVAELITGVFYPSFMKPKKKSTIVETTFQRGPAFARGIELVILFSAFLGTK